MPKKPRQNNTPRKPTGSSEGRHSSSGRSSEELVIEYPATACKDSPVGAHHYIRLPRSSIYRCKYCWAAVWLPTEWNDAIAFDVEVKHYGIQKAYRKRLLKIPKTLSTVEFLMSLRTLRHKDNIDENDILRVVYDILQPKEYSGFDDFLRQKKINFREVTKL